MKTQFSSTNSLAKSHRSMIQVPGFTLPFNIVGWIVWAVLLRADMPVKEEEVEVMIAEEIDWTKLFLGSVVAMSQVHAKYLNIARIANAVQCHN